jgi:hypothetical protein
MQYRIGGYNHLYISSRRVGRRCCCEIYFSCGNASSLPCSTPTIDVISSELCRDASNYVSLASLPDEWPISISSMENLFSARIAGSLIFRKL